jgi:hypothetical protein
MDAQQKNNQNTTGNLTHAPAEASQCIEWYGPGAARAIEVGDMRVIVRVIGRRGRRTRILIVGPPSATFKALDRSEAAQSLDRSI